MRKESSENVPMLYWSDYFDEDDSREEESACHADHVSHRGLLIALVLSSLLWGLILVTSHLLL